MNELTEILRGMADMLDGPQNAGNLVVPSIIRRFREAADTIERLETENATLRKQQEQPNEPLCGLTNAQLGRLVRNSYIEGYEDGQNGKPSLEKIEPLTLKRFEAICESVHNGWWEEKKRQGVTKHPDMLPYSELAEEVKEYDRVTVRRVLDALGIPYRRMPEQEG